VYILHTVYISHCVHYTLYILLHTVHIDTYYGSDSVDLHSNCCSGHCPVVIIPDKVTIQIYVVFSEEDGKLRLTLYVFEYSSHKELVKLQPDSCNMYQHGGFIQAPL